MVGGQVSLDDTWLRKDHASGPLFLPPSVAAMPNAHPYVQSSLLQKIYNNITTTSNVFAVWWTAGYFEVVDENVRPVKLGKEIGRDENRHIRHRFFAVVDRSALQLWSAKSPPGIKLGPPPPPPPSGLNPPTAGQTMTIDTGTMTTTTGTNFGTYNASQTYHYGDIVTFGLGKAAPILYVCIKTAPPSIAPTPNNLAYWQPAVQPGMLLEIDAGTPNAEVVAVLSVSGYQFTANFTKTHIATATISCRGNPGPQDNYNPHRDNHVVLHLSVIQ
jgi:hypothetical protein